MEINLCIMKKIFNVREKVERKVLSTIEFECLLKQTDESKDE